MSNSTFAALVVLWFIGTSSAMAKEPPPPTNDAQIVAIIGAANDGEIAAGRLAKSKAASREVKAFADKMVADHTRLDNSATGLAAKMRMRPETTLGSERLKGSTILVQQRLSSLSGTEFDKAYVEAQIKGNQMVLDTLDQQLIPNAKSSELKAELQRARPVIAGLLQDAQQLQLSLGSDSK
ncbi:MAG TPA: DUF4142 domain-containing protein [Rhodocyclaceae bacterium]|nr:DUF4142 domain-containing protein [Rhodocyclaceae bacterium]